MNSKYYIWYQLLWWEMKVGNKSIKWCQTLPFTVDCSYTRNITYIRVHCIKRERKWKRQIWLLCFSDGGWWYLGLSWSWESCHNPGLGVKFPPVCRGLVSAMGQVIAGNNLNVCWPELFDRPQTSLLITANHLEQLFRLIRTMLVVFY